MSVEQKLVTLRMHDGELYNFFHTGGSCDSLHRHLQEGWLVKYIRDDKTMVAVLFERERAADRHSMYAGCGLRGCAICYPELDYEKQPPPT